MRFGMLRIVTATALLAWAGFFWLASRERAENPARASRPAKPDAQRHYVTAEQLVECGALADRRVKPFSAIAHDGVRFNWPGAGSARPLVLFFIKRDCPCSVEFEPFFHRLAERYRDTADFIGVIDSGAEVARAYAVANRVPYPVLADPDREIIARLEAKHGGYVALLSSSGVVDALWPGCSADMMSSLGRRIAVIGATAERPIDCSDMPKVLTTGCPFAS
jgi:peroxiredoxin